MIISLAIPALLIAMQAPAPDTVGVRLQSLVDSVLEARPRVPGALVYLESTKTGKRWTVASGKSDTARGEPLEPHQPVRIASVTKTYTAAAILRLMERGVVKLDDPISRHITSEYAVKLRQGGLNADSITIRQLLGHRGGLADHTNVPSYIPVALANPRKRWTRDEQVQWLVDSLRPVGPPGAQFRYSDTGYIILGGIVERHMKKSFGPAVRELLDFDRLGLRETWFETLEPEPAGVAPRAHQYMSGVDTYGMDPSVDLYGGGGIVASVSDVGAFFTALLGRKVFERPATLDTMMVVQPGLMDGYGLGIFRMNSGGRIGYGHSGFWGVLAVHYPQEGLTVAISVNEQSQGSTLFGILNAVLRDVAPLLE